MWSPFGSIIRRPVQLPAEWELCGGHVQKGNQLQGVSHRIQRIGHQSGAHQLHGAHRGGAGPAGQLATLPHFTSMLHYVKSTGHYITLHYICITLRHIYTGITAGYIKSILH